MTALFKASEKKSTTVSSQNNKSGVSGVAKSASEVAKKETVSRKEPWVDKAIAVNKRLGHEATQGLLDKLYSISGDKVNYDKARKEMPEPGSAFVHLVLSTQKILFPLEKEKKEWDGILGAKTIKRGEEALAKNLHASTLWNALSDFLSGVNNTASDWWDSFVEWASSRSEAEQEISKEQNPEHIRDEKLESASGQKQKSTRLNTDQTETLATRTAKAIAVYETNRGGNAPVATESALQTTAGVAASVKSIGQTIISNAITQLRRFPALRRLTTPELTMKELNQANARVSNVWKIHKAAMAAPATMAFDTFIKNISDQADASGLTKDQIQTIFNSRVLRAKIRKLHEESGGERQKAKELAATIPEDQRFGINQASLASYIRSPGNWGENRAAWARVAVEAMPNNIGKRIIEAATHNSGITMTFMDIKKQTQQIMGRDVQPTIEACVLEIAGNHNQDKSYPDGVWKEYKRLYPTPP